MGAEHLLTQLGGVLPQSPTAPGRIPTAPDGALPHQAAPGRHPARPRQAGPR